MPEYRAPAHDELDETHVCAALDFLVAVEPYPPAESREEYELAIAPFKRQIAQAMATLRKFGEQTRPLTLEELQREYVMLTTLPRYATSRRALPVVTSALKEAWHGVGPWRR